MRKTARPKEIVLFLERHGFWFSSQKGSHAIYRHDDGRRTAVPMHSKELKKGTLHSILKDIGMTLEDLD